MQQANISNYDVIDPISHNINKNFTAVLELKDPTGTGFDSSKTLYYWSCTEPKTSMPSDQKIKIANYIKQIGEFLKTKEDPGRFRSKDLPKNLEQWLEENPESEIIMKLEDGRIIGIYPDDSKLPHKHDLEVHKSTLVNVEKLTRLFNAKEIFIRE